MSIAFQKIAKGTDGLHAEVPGTTLQVIIGTDSNGRYLLLLDDMASNSCEWMGEASDSVKALLLGTKLAEGLMAQARAHRLFDLLADNAGAWGDEEDSVKEEHAELIARNEAELKDGIDGEQTADITAQMRHALVAIKTQRDYFAENQDYADVYLRPASDQCFDDWAADLAEQAMAGTLKVYG